MSDLPPPITIETGDPSLFFGYPLLLDQLATTTFDSDNGVHSYAFDVEEGLHYQLEITVTGDRDNGFTQSLDPLAEIERFDGSIIGASTALNGDTLRYSFVADESDSWTLRLSDLDFDDFYNQTYSVRIIGSDWIPETADTTAAFNNGQVVDNGAVFVSRTDFLGDVDMIAVNLEAGVNYGFFLSSDNPDYDPRLTLYDTDGATNLVQKHVYNGITTVNYTPDTDGVYFFEARDNLGNDEGWYIAGVYSNGADSLEGTDNADAITAGGGDDWVVTFGGADTVYGGGGNDTVNGGFGTDQISGGNGDDSLFGGKATDTLAGADGNDNINGNNGDDVIYGGTGADTLSGGLKADDIFGGQDDDLIAGNKGYDELTGGAGEDTLWGNRGDDTLNGGFDDDDLYGNIGRDVFLFFDGWGNDRIMDFEHDDVILFAGINNLNSVDQLVITDDGGDMMIAFGDNTVRILNGTNAVAMDDIDVI